MGQDSQIHPPVGGCDNNVLARNPGYCPCVYIPMAQPSTPHPSAPARSGLPRWLKISIISVLVMANLAVLAFIWLIRTGNNLLSSADTNSEVSGFLDPSSGDTRTFLLVGSDSRAGLDDLTNFGNVGGARSDVIILVKVQGSSAHMLSVPRDLYVEIPGNGKNKINAAYAFGGAPLLVETVTRNLGVSVNHYVEIDFVGFRSLVDDVGGIEMTFPYPARDVKSGLDVSAGEHLLDGDQALAYARSRSYQELQGGSWVSVDANDIGRTGRQQEVMRAIFSRLKSPGSVAEAGNLATTVGQHTTVDSRLAESSVASLIWGFRGVFGGRITGETLPTTTSTVGGASVQLLDQPEAGEVLAAFAAGGAERQDPLRLEVLNGNGRAGAAGEMSDRLEALGFVVASVGNSGSSDYAETTVIGRTGSEAAQRVRDALGFGVVQVGSVDSEFDAVVIVGSDAP